MKVSDDSLYVTFIGSDFVEEGRRGVNWLAKATNGKAVIAELVELPARRQLSIAKKDSRKGSPSILI